MLFPVCYTRTALKSPGHTDIFSQFKTKKPPLNQENGFQRIKNNYD